MRPRRFGFRNERGRDTKMTVDELSRVTVEELLDIAKDKWKSRSLQRSLMENDVEITDCLIEKFQTEGQDCFVHLLSDQYGNYLAVTSMNAKRGF